MLKKYSSILAVCLLAVFLASCQGISLPGMKPYREVRIPFAGSPNQTLQAFVYNPAGNAKHDVVILNQGSSGGNPKVSEPMELQAHYFVEKGFIVVVPMRKGRGTSDGISLESEVKNCDVNSWQPGIVSALDDLSAAIKYAQSLPNFDRRIVLVGVSRGGYLSVAYGAQGLYRDKVAAVVSFAGSWVAQTEDQCPQDFNLVSFSALGGIHNPPNLWLYADNDAFNDAASIKQYYAGFNMSNPDRKMVMYSNVPGNGHFLADHQDFWEKDVSAFLEQFQEK